MSIRKSLQLAAIIAALLAASSAIASAQDAPKAESGVKPLEKIEGNRKVDVGEAVDRLIADLGAEKFATREDAATRLEKLGADALPALRRHLDHEDPEVRARVRALVDRLEGKGEELSIPDDEKNGGDPSRPRELRRLPPDDRRQGPRARFSIRGLDDLFNSFEGFEDDFPGFKEHFGFGFGPGQSMTIRPDGQGGMAFSSRSTMESDGKRLTWTQSNDSCELEVVDENGEKKSYAARDLDDFKSKYPEVHSTWESSGIFDSTRIRAFPFGSTAPGTKEEDGMDPLDRFGEEREGARDLWQRMDEMMRRQRELFESRMGETRRLRIDPFGGIRAPEPARLGIVISPVDGAAVPGFDAKKAGAEGVQVVEVEKDSLAAAIGLKEKDIITAFDGKAIGTTEILARSFRELPEGQAFKLEVWRGGEKIEVAGKKPETRKAAPAAPRRLRKL